MKNLFFLITFISLMIISCSSDDDISPSSNPNSSTDNKVDLGSYTLLQESIDKLPYLNKSEVIFNDAEGNTISVKIRNMDVFSGEVSFERNGTTYEYTLETKPISSLVSGTRKINPEPEC